jgi:hypothetical protein
LPGPSEIVPVQDSYVERPKQDPENPIGEEVAIGATGTGVTGVTGTGVTGTTGTGVTTPVVPQHVPVVK